VGLKGIIGLSLDLYFIDFEVILRDIFSPSPPAPLPQGERGVIFPGR
jgi:hypothetical protein